MEVSAPGATRLAFDLPEAVLALLGELRAAGGRSFLVGGAVRDRLLGLPTRDLDVEVFHLAPDRLRSLLAARARVEEVGEAFGVFKVAGLAGLEGELDVSIPRRDSKVGRGHRGFRVEGDPELPVEEASRRRDFTVNAILADPLTGELVDPFGGRADLDARTLRVVDAERFRDDSLRVLRGAQLAARFDLRPDPATERTCRTISLSDLPAERIAAEMSKLLLRAPRPSVGFELLREWGRLAEVAPELLPTIGCPQEPAWHPEGDVWAHTLLALDRIPEVTGAEGWGALEPERAWTVALAILCHDLGKPVTTAHLRERWRSLDHESAGVAPTAALLARWNVHGLHGFDVRAQVVGLVANHLKPGQFHDRRDEVGDGAFRRLARSCDLDLLARVAAADSLGRAGAFDDRAMRWFAARAEELSVAHRPPEPLLLGRHLLALGMAPGPAIGRLLARVYELQLDGAVTTLEEAIAAAKACLAEGE